MVTPIDPATISSPANVLTAFPFDTIIGGPLKASVEAQASAAQTAARFLQGINSHMNKDDQNLAPNVSFQFIKEGKVTQLNIPLLTIVPIPYIAIQEPSIDFSLQTAGSSPSVKSIRDDSQNNLAHTPDFTPQTGLDNMPEGLSKLLHSLAAASHSSSSNKGQSQPGLPCPNCGTFIPVSPAELLSGSSLVCPAPQCRLELVMDQNLSHKSLEQLNLMNKGQKN